MYQKFDGPRKLTPILVWDLRFFLLNLFPSAENQEVVGDTLEELWISYNGIEKLKGITVLKKLKVLYMSNNFVKEWAEFNKLTELPHLEDLLFVGNPLEEKHTGEGDWRKQVAQRLKGLKKLDGDPVIREDDNEGGD